MALQNSGPISLLNIQNEFGGSNPIKLSEYYGSGGAPGSGAVRLGDFYGLSNAVVARVLAVGGGGAGGNGSYAAGGGAGGVALDTTLNFTPGATYDITVGTPGLAEQETPFAVPVETPSFGTVIVRSTASTVKLSGGMTLISATGGGVGGGELDAELGGGGGLGDSIVKSPATRNPGGNGGTHTIENPDTDTPRYIGGGGGGAGGNGSSSTGKGGNGFTSNITGSNVKYGGGGGGGTITTFGQENNKTSGGSGGGGAGAEEAGTEMPFAETFQSTDETPMFTLVDPATPGVNGKGGGGGGGARGLGADGGSGVVIIRCSTVATTVTGNPTVTTVGGDTVYTFNTDGTITF